MSATTAGRFNWTNLTPVVAAIALLVAWGSHPGTLASIVIGLILVGAVLAAVHHAEVVAHRVGEPFGSLILAVAVTVIEVGLIVMLMVSGGAGTETLARDTVFAAAMITLNGIVGISLVVGAAKHHMAVFNAEGTGSALATVLALAGLTLVVPTFTSVPGPVFTGSQLAFAAVASLVLYGSFVFTQTVRHRDFYLPVDTNGRRGVGTATLNDAALTGEPRIEEPADLSAEDSNAANRQAWISLALLVVALVAVVGLAKVESYSIKNVVDDFGLPHAVVGVVIALLVLAPETIAAARAAAADKVQISLNLAYGSAMASIGLTIPAIAVASIWLEGDLALGLEPLQLTLLVLSAVVATLSVVPGRAKPLTGIVHLVLLAAFLFLTISP